MFQQIRASNAERKQPQGMIYTIAIAYVIPDTMLQYPDHLVKDGFRGGQIVAEELRSAVKQHLKDLNHHLLWDEEILIYTWVDAERLADEYLDSGIISRPEEFLKFRAGLNFAPELTTYWDICALERSRVTRKLPVV